MIDLLKLKANRLLIFATIAAAILKRFFCIDFELCGLWRN